jgi:phosphoribosylformylglycinamidine (FGAM) synthase-like enzyme
MKVETHNHPTAIAPNPGAATGSGGEIRDEGATGQGSTHIPISGGLLISPKIAQYIRTTKFIVKASSANGTLKHNI